MAAIGFPVETETPVQVGHSVNKVSRPAFTLLKGKACM
jgi:hypothetical protein